MSDSDSIKTRTFTAERNVDFSFIIAYKTDSINENQLLYELAKYNFSNFLVRNFEITTEEVEGLERMVVSGFKSYDEALQYARQLYSNKNILSLTRKCRSIIISDSNKELLGTRYSYNDYDKFYEKHFIPLRISTVQLLTEPATIEYEKQPEEEKKDENELINGGVIDDDTYMQIGIDPSEKTEEDNSVTIPTDTENNTKQVEEENSITVPTEENATEENKEETFDIAPEQPATKQNAEEDIDSGFTNTYISTEVKAESIPETNTGNKTEVKTVSKTKAKAEPKPEVKPATPQQQPKEQDNGIHFNDDIDSNEYNIQPSSNKKQQQDFNLEDDYYELDGF